jgi:hypothetical protein
MESCELQLLHIAGQEHNDGRWSLYDLMKGSKQWLRQNKVAAAMEKEIGLY